MVGWDLCLVYSRMQCRCPPRGFIASRSAFPTSPAPHPFLLLVGVTLPSLGTEVVSPDKMWPRQIREAGRGSTGLSP